VKGVKAFSTIDTTAVKTFKDLGDTISGKITSLAKQVDANLGLDSTKTLLKDLYLSAKTTAGKIIRDNPIELALNQLDELYTKIGDTVKSANIKELIQEATEKGLTKLEINDIARVYGQEFGAKAFSKLGDPLTSVNAKLFEGTRKKLKELARQGITGSDAKIADEAMSNLFSVKTLIQKMLKL